MPLRDIRDAERIILKLILKKYGFKGRGETGLQAK
jgi:hypothetical protein